MLTLGAGDVTLVGPEVLALLGDLHHEEVPMTSLMSRPGSSGEPDEETIALERKLFRKRRRWGRLGRMRPWLGALLAVVLLVAGAYVVWFSPLLATEEVSVTGTGALAPVQVREAARVPIGEPLARLDLDAVRGRVASLPEVKSVRVTRAWPHGSRSRSPSGSRSPSYPAPEASAAWPPTASSSAPTTRGRRACP